jgi:hypothetical protein
MNTGDPDVFSVRTSRQAIRNISQSDGDLSKPAHQATEPPSNRYAVLYDSLHRQAGGRSVGESNRQRLLHKMFEGSTGVTRDIAVARYSSTEDHMGVTHDKGKVEMVNRKRSDEINSHVRQ